MNAEMIFFPEAYHPEKTLIHVRNKIEINAAKEYIWYWLIHAPTWPEWYANSANVQILEQTEQHLKAGTRFNWRTFNTNIHSEVRVFKPYHRLAWTAKGTGLLAYHAWLITPSDQGYTVITEETQQGWLPWLGKRFIQKSLYNQHQRWLEGLKGKAESMYS
ncbi:MAG: SRPBCC domain-containing protein [Bacteroidota bacterium]